MQDSRKLRTLLLAVSIAPEQIGERIRDARRAKGWSQLQFAIEAHVSPGTIYRWEKGQLPRVAELMRIAGLLGVEIDELVEPVGPTSPASTDVVVERIERVELAVESLRQELLAALQRRPSVRRDTK